MSVPRINLVELDNLPFVQDWLTGNSLYGTLILDTAEHPTDRIIGLGDIRVSILGPLSDLVTGTFDSRYTPDGWQGSAICVRLHVNADNTVVPTALVCSRLDNGAAASTQVITELPGSLTYTDGQWGSSEATVGRNTQEAEVPGVGTVVYEHVSVFGCDNLVHVSCVHCTFPDLLPDYTWNAGEYFDIIVPARCINYDPYIVTSIKLDDYDGTELGNIGAGTLAIKEGYNMELV